jgi:hypothetical protein
MRIPFFHLSISVLAVTCGLLVAAPAFSQAPGNDSTAAKQTFREKAAARRNAIENRKRAKEEQLKEAEKRDIAAMKVRKRKKDACSKQAKAQKLHLLKRRKFMKKCMAG